ncbi:hypothetical protein BU15DRAFT_74809 [Melanogaster broomeanus]|nr:hypothetical protein BU15DRAFT_74809 [Melanogaster broomeanus]
MATLPAPQCYPWLLSTNRNLPAYTRPLVGSELLMHRITTLNAGRQISFILSKPELHIRARGAFERLRFHCPMIAASIDNKASWVYNPVQDDDDREAWLQRAFVFEDKGSGSTYALVFHGPHSMIDAWPAMNALSLMFEWMSVDPPLDKPDWGSEWKNLPPDPITAMGGPCTTWDTDAVRLFEDIAANASRQATCLTLDDPRPIPSRGESIRIMHRFTEDESRAILAVAKQNGCSITHLVEAARCLAMVTRNPPNVEADPAREVDFGSELTIASLHPRLSKSHFVSAFSCLPIQIRVTEILKNNSEVQRMHLTMKALRAQYDYYLGNPCIYHSLAAREFSTTFQVPTVDGLMTNIGVIEKRLQTKWKGQQGEPVFEIDEFSLACRIVAPVVLLHSWTFKDALYVQIGTSDAWRDAEGNDTIMHRLFDEIVRHIQLLLPGVPELE